MRRALRIVGETTERRSCCRIRIALCGTTLKYYSLQAAIVACHMRARTAEETDWERSAAVALEAPEYRRVIAGEEHERNALVLECFSQLARHALGCAIWQAANWSRFNFYWHASVQTTERHVGYKQKLRHAVNDSIQLEGAPERRLITRFLSK